MSNAAVIIRLSREIAEIQAGIDRVTRRVARQPGFARGYLDAAAGHLAQANFALAVAQRAGVDPVVEVSAA